MNGIDIGAWMTTQMALELTSGIARPRSTAVASSLALLVAAYLVWRERRRVSSVHHRAA